MVGGVCRCDQVCLPPGLSLVTNMVIMEHDSDTPPPTHQEVMETGR